jgi:outer membrane receptor for ferric coprogen and ferric-rhodotorulic acid
LSLRETPQSITVVTRQQMDDFGLDNVDKVLENTSSVSVSKMHLGNSYISRGFELQIRYDGMTNPSGVGISGLGAIATAAPDSAFLDHVEIQQGAAGLLSGAGEPGGTINLVRKRPTEIFQGQIEAGLGSWDKRRLVGDLSGPLVESGAILGRIVLVSDDSDSYVDHAFADKKALYGVIEARPAAGTTLGFSLQYQKDRVNENFFGYPTAPDGRDLNWNRSTFFGMPDGRLKTEDTRATLYLEQKLSETWALKANYTHSVNEWDAVYGPQYSVLDLATGDGLKAWAVNIRQKTTGDALEAYAEGAGNLLGRRHEFVLGFNGMESKNRRGTWNGPDVPFNIYSYDPASVMPYINMHPAYGDPEKVRQYGLWGVARLNLADPLKLILGARVSWYRYWNSNGVKTMEENAVFSPYAGIVYDLSERFSVYASYSDIFKPQSNLDRSGNVLEPIVGANYEAGIKGEFFNKRLNTAAAVFRLEQTNLAAQDDDFGRPNNVCPSWCYIAQGEVISEGVDLSLNGAVTPNWHVGAGYTYVKSEYATGAQKGERYEPRNPRHAFRLSTTYRIPATNWTVGGNLRAQSATYRDDFRGIRIKQGGFSLLDLVARYQVSKQAEVSVQATNVFDRKYRYPNLLHMTQYGEPRRLAINVRYFF